MIAGVQLFNILKDIVDGRVYFDQVDETATNDRKIKTPYIVYQYISNVPEVALDGMTGHEWVRMQIDVYHTDKHNAIILANTVAQAINDNIKPSIYSDRRSMRDGTLYRESIDFEFWQTAPTTTEGD